MVMELHELASMDPSVVAVLEGRHGFVYNDSIDMNYGTDKFEVVSHNRIRLTYVQPPVTVTDINVPPVPSSEEDTMHTRLAVWSGLPPPSQLLSEYEVASVAPGCICLRHGDEQEVSAVLVQFRPRAMLDDSIPLTKEAADFLMQFRADVPADATKETLRVVLASYTEDWPTESIAIHAFAPEVHLYCDGSYGLRCLEHIARTTMLPFSFDSKSIPGWLAIRVHCPGVFVCRDYFVCYDPDQDAEELVVELHDQYKELLQPLQPLPAGAQLQPAQQQWQWRASRHAQQRQQQQQQQQASQPHQQQPLEQEVLQQEPQLEGVHQAAGVAQTAPASPPVGAVPEVWPAFDPTTYLGDLHGFRSGSIWRMSGTTFAALHLTGSVLKEGGGTVVQEVQIDFLGRSLKDKSDLTVYYDGTYADGHFTHGSSASTLHFRINSQGIKMTALKVLLRAMHGGQLPPAESWLALVRHQDGKISAHIWPAGSHEAGVLAQFDTRMTDAMKIRQRQMAAEELAKRQPQRGAAAGQAGAAAGTIEDQDSGSSEEQSEQDDEGSSSGSSDDEPEEEESAGERPQPAGPPHEAAAMRGTLASSTAQTAVRPAVAGEAQHRQAGEQQAVGAAHDAAAATGAVAQSAAESSDESGAAAALGLLRQDQAPVVALRPPPPAAKLLSRQQQEAAKLAAARQQARAREEAGMRSRDARAEARRLVADAQQQKRGAEQGAGPSQPPSKRQQRDKRQAAAAAAAKAAADDRGTATAGPSISRSPHKPALPLAVKRQRTEQQQRQPAGVGKQVQPNRQQPSNGEASMQLQLLQGDQGERLEPQQEQDQHRQSQKQRGRGRPSPGKQQEVTAAQREPPQDGTDAQQLLQLRSPQIAAGPAPGAAQAVGTAQGAAAAGGDGAEVQLPQLVLQLLHDVLGSHPGTIASLAGYLVSQGLSAFSDLAHVMDNELVAAAPGMTPLLARRLRWAWYVRGWGNRMRLSAEEVAWYEQDYDSMQEFYAKGGWR